MCERVCLIAYHEIGLKGRNRSTFERRLRDNLEAALVTYPVRTVERLASRMAVTVNDETRLTDVAHRISRVPGVGSVALAYRVSQDPSVMEQTALQAVQELPQAHSFRVLTKRSNTNHPERSLEINRRVGAFIAANTGLRVDLSDPDVTVNLTVTKGDTYVFTSKIAGVGGLPVGSAGTIVSLLSNGIDSPVATWRMMRRGAVVVGVHFSGRPHVSDASERIVAELGALLEQTGGLGRIYIVPFGDVQRDVSLHSPPDLRVILYRRLMIKIAERIAAVERGRALVTGESLGQVASQTLHNIQAVDEAATLPVLRPLIGSDKLEIMEEARRIGTYDLSVQDAEDCCTLFMPRNPETHARLDAVLRAWEALEPDSLVQRAMEQLEWLDFKCPAYRPPRQWPTPAGLSGYSLAAVSSKRVDKAAQGDE